MFFFGIAGQFVPYILFTGLLMVFSFGNITDSMGRAVQPINEKVSCVLETENNYFTIQQSDTNYKENIIQNRNYSHFYMSISKDRSDVSYITDKNPDKNLGSFLYSSLYTAYYSGLAPPSKKI